MKVLTILLLFLFVSFQSGATGYSYNMFVAHKKLQTVKESKKACTSEVKTKKPVKIAAVRATPPTQSLTNQLSDKMAKMVTLNERIIAEGPSFLFESEEEETASKSVVSKVSKVVQKVFYSMIGSQVIGKE